MEMVLEIEEMIEKYSDLSEDSVISDFIEDLKEIKEEMNFGSKGF